MRVRHQLGLAVGAAAIICCCWMAIWSWSRAFWIPRSNSSKRIRSTPESPAASRWDDASNYEFKSRKQRLHLIYPQGDTDHLGGGGLYRRAAIEKIGYLTNLNLHGYEEAELGIRLQAAGYKLHRLAAPYFSHASYTMPTFKMLAYRWKNGFLWAPGERSKPPVKPILVAAL